jgi:hypothetical protein
MDIKIKFVFLADRKGKQCYINVSRISMIEIVSNGYDIYVDNLKVMKISKQQLDELLAELKKD